MDAAPRLATPFANTAPSPPEPPRIPKAHTSPRKEKFGVVDLSFGQCVTNKICLSGADQHKVQVAHDSAAPVCSGQTIDFPLVGLYRSALFALNCQSGALLYRTEKRSPNLSRTHPIVLPITLSGACPVNPQIARLLYLDNSCAQSITYNSE